MQILAREVVNARKAVTRIHTAKANLSSVEMQMKAQASQLRIAGCLSKSTDVMKSMQQLVKMPEIQKTMMEMSKEMMKVNINIYTTKEVCININISAFNQNMNLSTFNIFRLV